MIGYRISKLRTERRITTQNMADSIGIERSLLLDYENENVDPPDEHLQLIAGFLGVTTERLKGTDIDLSQCNFHVYGKQELTEEDLEDVRDAIREIRIKKNLYHAPPH
ncbi:helix-turn-helix transcriptional regulator [Paenibacillus naphthalenovorans]|uniref:helix-turn-helix transcriptional regulator n=1 Tax=Paenibacillus naphthalenovorans TaxID=162209 RepID=UPI00088F6BB3|nr:helix-turn-helix transcriptional regulator [Paenibacillus naphthalenovorans]SDI48611.1 Transcriptional regulator, contains XRE-family HTH domain [Paenibacillus naphthalenovorans]